MVYFKDVYPQRQPNARRAEAGFEHVISFVAICISEGLDVEDSIDDAPKFFASRLKVVTKILII
jgi:hypothetical protein